MPKSKSKKRRKTALSLVFLVPLLFFAFIFSLVLSAGAVKKDASNCNPTQQVSAAAVDVDSVPAGPIAGYGHQQLVNAAQIMLAAQKLGLTVRDQTIGVMVAMGESSLISLDHGDAVGPDSRGLFQQRGNGAWGSLSDRMNPFISATNFFKQEMSVPGREAMEPTMVAHHTQGNADPNYYRPYWQPAQEVVQALSGIQAATGDTDASQATTLPANAGHQAGVNFATAGMKPQTVAVANTIGTMFHLKTIGGYRPMSSPYDDPIYGHSSGLAIDFMINDIPNGVATGYSLANYVKDHTKELGVRYIIYHQHIWAPYRADEGWRLMPDRGDPTQNHMDHVHVSLDGTGGTDFSKLAALGTTPTDTNTTTGCTGTEADTTTSTGTAPTSKTGWTKPANGPITSPFGMRTNPATGVYNLHSGIDIGADCYAPIYAANSGTVTQAGPASGYGNLITLDNGDGIVTRYAHMFDNGILVHAGDRVKSGQQIGKVGTYGNSTGCHLHFEVKKGGQFTDPKPFLAGVGIAFG